MYSLYLEGCSISGVQAKTIGVERERRGGGRPDTTYDGEWREKGNRKLFSLIMAGELLEYCCPGLNTPSIIFCNSIICTAVFEWDKPAATGIYARNFPELSPKSSPPCCVEGSVVLSAGKKY